jgi:hypothetical protein
MFTGEDTGDHRVSEEEDHKMLKAEGEAEEAKIERRVLAEPFTLKPQAPAPKAQVVLVRLDKIKEGDRVGLYGIPADGQVGLGAQGYKIVRIRKNGSVVLKLSKK